MSTETPTSTDEEKPETLFVRCSVVVVGIFTAASAVNLVVFAAFILDRRWGLLGGFIDEMPVFSNHNWYVGLLPFVWGILLQLAWWIFLTFCYICGKYDQVAEKYYDLKWFVMWGGMPMPFRFHLFPLAYALFGFTIIGMLTWLAVGVVWIWNLIFKLSTSP